MLDGGSSEVGCETTYDHGEHVDACHDGVHVKLDLEIERDPEVEDWEAEKAKGNNYEELLRGISKEPYMRIWDVRIRCNQSCLE